MKISPRKVILFLLLTGCAGLACFSLYIAFHEPDRQETVLLGQTRLASNGPAAMRVLVRDRIDHRPVPGAEVKLSLSNVIGIRIPLGDFKTAADGTLGESFPVGDIAPGEYTLNVASHSPLGSDRIESKVEIFKPARLLVSSDKPIYQPGQTIRLRALMTNGVSQKPAKLEPITFEVSDSKGNKVFREQRTSSRFGIASADFELARELNLGTYHISALSGSATAEQTVEIQRYALPKFKIGVTTDKSYYRPGEKLRGVVEAAYFFGQPVGGAAVKVTASVPGEKSADIGAAGVTDAEGKFAFSIVAPLAPQMEQNGVMDIAVEAKDMAGHVERKTVPITLAVNELQITAFPEQGEFVPGVENQVFVITNDPDGQPSPCEVTMGGRIYKTDPQGICVIDVLPSWTQSQLEISARDTHGQTAKVTLWVDNSRGGSSVTVDPGAEASPISFSSNNDRRQLPKPELLLRPEKAGYRPGEKVSLTLLSPTEKQAVFVDVIRDHRTVLTRSVVLIDHHGELAFDLQPDITGLLRIYAYTIGESGEQSSSSRLIYVNPASNLRIAATRDREVYRPGETAKLAFLVTDQNNRPAPSALGINIVDESVSALADAQPGFGRQSFDAARQALAPRFQLRLFSSPMRLLQDAGKHPLAAQAYLASLDRLTDGRSLEDLAGDYLNPEFIKHLRSMQGTPAYEHYRHDPQFAECIRLLEDPRADYTLSAATGAKKARDVERRRRNYFDALTDYLGILFFASILAVPILAIYFESSRSKAANAAAMALTSEVRALVKIASGQHRALSLFTVGPYLYYLLVGMAISVIHPESQVWFWGIALASEVLIVLAGCAFLLRRAAGLKALGFASETTKLQQITVLYMAQVVIARLMVIALNDDTILWLVLPILVTPWLALVFSSIRTSHMLTERGASKEAQPSSSVLFAMAVVFILFILLGIALPVFSSVTIKGLQAQALSDLKQLDLARQIAEQDASKAPPGASQKQPRLRRDFPETLFWQPELITDEEGRATLEVPLADSITTWRASFDAVALSGAMANSEMPIRAYQDFFVEIELPETLTLGDSFSVPVLCHNYLDAPQEVRLTLGDDNWFETSSDRTRTVKLAAHEVQNIDFPVTVTRVGMKRLRVTAQGSAASDAIEREIRIAPSGRRVERTENDVLRDTVALSMDLPAAAIPDASSLTVRLYPSHFSEVVEGLGSIFRAPYGCFEQTSSVTYPNVLALDYMKSTGRLEPDVERAARKYINDGYQRLLTFEVRGGGFEWYGSPPANVCLTAYGILELSDMTRVHPVDSQLIQRALSWLSGMQAADGSWTEANRGWTWTGRGSMTAYVAWALAESGDKSPQLRRALDFLAKNPAQLDSTYSKALAANAFLARDHDDPSGRSLAAELAGSAQHPARDAACWKSTGESMCYSSGESLAIETTALAALALMKDGRWPETAKQALTWISRQKAKDGGWNTTQATILAMRALIAGGKASLGSDQASEVAVMLNGAEIRKVHINKDNNDVMQLVSLTGKIQAGENRVELRREPAGELSYQISEAYSLPAQVPEPEAVPSPLQIDVAYDRTTLAVDDLLTCSVIAQNHSGRDIPMPIVTLGIPPGFEVETVSFEAMQSGGKIAKYEIKGDQVILYLRELSAATPMRFDYFLRARYPLHLQAPTATLYEYYTPENRASSRPPVLTVSPRQ